MGLFEGSSLIWLGLIGALITYRLFNVPRLKRDGVPLKTPPNTLPLVGNGILFLQARQKLFSWFAKCERQFGYETFQISVPTLPPGVVINDPQNLEYVFKNEGTFVKGDFFTRNSWDLFGNGIITVDGELWKVQRKAGLSFLSVANLRVLTDVALPKYLGQSVEHLKRKSACGVVVDLQTVFHEITSQLMGKMAYNMEMHADDEFTMAFDHTSGVTAERFQNPFWFVTEIFTGGPFRRSLSIVRSFGQKIVQSASEDSHHTKTSHESKLDEVSGTLIQSLMSSLGDEKMVAEAALNYLSAGRDTVAQALTWTMMLLMHNRFATCKVRREVQELVEIIHVSADHNGEEDGPFNTAAFTPASLPYTMAVFYESLRLYPPIPFEIKQCAKATTFPDGTFLPADSIVVWCPWAMNRSRVTWGDDADIFRPERWLLDGKFVTKSASEFPVFNGGARSCLGKRMAELMAVQVLATMVLGFDFMPAYGTQRVSKSSLTLPMEGGLPCYVRARNDVGD
ncbi:cytochrome P450 [Pseudomassariella vexata]|uniref:Cytochrome P450 n=1 Tax=Pseudomassariella vexata TaxID=1141098 RepID=A0A1Y2DEL6_9PEZI|nr:cytochrome P450 [Pseudomassariella vexata]ORY57576.1 cytochrome P450 [Pseudomassariella vexata]